MEEKKYGFIKFFGVTAAAILILFGGMDNAWRTVRYWWERIEG